MSPSAVQTLRLPSHARASSRAARMRSSCTDHLAWPEHSTVKHAATIPHLDTPQDPLRRRCLVAPSARVGNEFDCALLNFNPEATLKSHLPSAQLMPAAIAVMLCWQGCNVRMSHTQRGKKSSEASSLSTERNQKAQLCSARAFCRQPQKLGRWASGSSRALTLLGMSRKCIC